MTRLQKLGAAAIAAGLSLAPSVVNAQAATQFIAGGSSAVWQTTGIAAWELSGKLHHYTFKLTGAGVGVVDQRNTTSIAPQQGSMYIVWDNSTAPTKIFVGVSLDSAVGDRLFLGTTAAGGPAGKLVLPATIPAAANLISVVWGTDDATLPAAVIADINASPVINGAFTDIRPEDAAYQTIRSKTALGTGLSDGSHTYGGLGYTGALSATVTPTNWIESAYSTAAFQVVPFVTNGKDPLSGGTVPPFTAYRVGFDPILILANRSNASGLGAKTGANYDFSNITAAQIVTLWNGTTCNTSVFGVSGAPSVALNVVLREPLSGTYNTFEYQGPGTPYNATLSAQTSQEKGVNPANANNNPLNLACTAGSGVRKRAIGTGEVVGTAILNNADSIAYAFYSYGNVSKIAANPSYGYLTVGGVDPLFASYTTNNGELPKIGVGTTPTFPHIKDGTYPLWSDLRIVTNNVAKNQTVAQSLANQIISDVNGGTQAADFLPFSSSLLLYRVHYNNGTYTNGTASNGLSGATENGGDVNGHIETTGNLLQAPRL